MKILTRIIGIAVSLFGLLFACFTNIGPEPTNFLTGGSGTLLFFSGIGLLLLKEWARVATMILLLAIFSYSIHAYYSAKESLVDVYTVFPIAIIIYLCIPRIIWIPQFNNEVQHGGKK